MGRFTVSKNLRLDGHPHATLDAVDLGRTLQLLNSPNVKLVDLTITGGHVSSSTSALGGGIHHAGGRLLLRGVRVKNNVAEATGSGNLLAKGGGLFSQDGRLTIIDSRFVGNTARASTPELALADGGGLYRFGSVELVETEIVSNRARATSSDTQARAIGGGVSVDGGDVAFRRSVIEGNHAVGRAPNGPATVVSAYGGGIGSDGTDSLTVTGTTLRENRASAIGPGGTVTAEGGGYAGYAGTAEVNRSVLAGNEARASSPGGALTTGRGGGLYIGTNRLFVRGSRIFGSAVSAESGGSATATGGGIDFWEDDLYMDSSRIHRNTVEAVGGSGPASARGGGLATRGHSVLEISRSTYDRNRAEASGPGGSEAIGGGLHVDGALLLRRSTVSRNKATSQGQSLGGGVHLAVADAAVAITNATLAENRAGGATARGGGIDSFANLELHAATLARNAAKLGGGLYVEGGTATLRATLLGLNTGGTGSPDCGGPVATAGHNLVAKLTGCTFTSAGSDRTNVGPKLGRLGSHGGPTQTVPIGRRSPALDAIGNARCVVQKDQRGVKRPQGRRCDIGAYERKPS